MSQVEKWVIRRADGSLVQSFKIDPSAKTVSCLIPNAPVKTNEGQNGPLAFRSESEAQALLATLAILVSTEYADATVVSYTRPTTE